MEELRHLNIQFNTLTRYNSWFRIVGLWIRGHNFFLRETVSCIRDVYNLDSQLLQWRCVEGRGDKWHQTINISKPTYISKKFCEMENWNRKPIHIIINCIIYHITKYIYLACTLRHADAKAIIQSVLMLCVFLPFASVSGANCCVLFLSIMSVCLLSFI